MFPNSRLTRLRRTEILRNLTAETFLEPSNFIYPIFVEENITENVEIQTMPGQLRIAEKKLPAYVKQLYSHGVRSIILFGVSHNKDATGSNSTSKDGLLARIIRSSKEACPQMLVIADNCFCEYTTHGHCGVLKNGYIDNDSSLELLGQQALNCARAGCDMVAPSAMLDGQVESIRSALDAENFNYIPIMSYAIKYASCFYGPFRDAAGSSIDSNNLNTDRKTYQMNIANSNEAMQEALLDESEGADILMVKPAGTNLDIIANLRQRTNLPIAAYQVSGEYSVIKSAAMQGLIDEKEAIIETLTSIKRAGASIIISYFTPEIIKILN